MNKRIQRHSFQIALPCCAAPRASGPLTHGPLHACEQVSRSDCSPTLVMSFDKFDLSNPPNATNTTTSISRDAVPELSAAFDPTGASNVLPAPESPPTSAPSVSGSKRQKLSRSKITKVTKPVQRSLSTPHVRALIMSDSEADKKRNKLGYQRISIACGEYRSVPNTCSRPSVATYLLTYDSSLSSTQDSMLGRRRRSTWQMSELHSIEERLCILPSRPAERDRKQLVVCWHGWCHIWTFICDVFIDPTRYCS